MHDARRFFRRRVDLPATLRVADRDTEMCRIENLSIDGAYVAVRPLPALAPVRVRFQLPGWAEPLDVVGTVSWSDQRGAGIHFRRLRTELVWKLGQYLIGVDDAN